MTTLGGFDPSRSLLPTGGGVIHVMSGGSMTQSLIPEVPARIHVMTGGDPPSNSVVNVTQPPENSPQTNTSTNQVAQPTTSVNQVASQNASAGPEVLQPTLSNQVVPQNAPSNQPVSQPASSNQVAPQNAPVSQVVSQNAPVSPVVQPTDSMNQVASQSTVSTQVNPQEEKTDESVKTNTASSNNKPKRKPEAPLSEDEKRVTLFGERLVLKKPRNNSTTFSDDQTRVFQLFGLQAASTDMKRSVLQALYDGSCDTNRSLITMRSCEPFRQIVRSLALRYLNKMNGEYVEEEEQKKEEQVIKNKQEDQEEIPTEKEINDSEDQGTDTTLEEINAMEKDLATMKEGLIPVLGIKNPSPAVSCYCISTVQLLFSLPEVRSAILQYPCNEPITEAMMTEATTEENRPSRIVCALKDVFLSLSEGMEMIDVYQKPSEAKTISEDSAKRIQYLMRIFNEKKGQQKNVENDAAEFLEFLMNEIAKIDSLKKLYDYIGIYNQVVYTCSTQSGNQGVPIQGESNDKKVTFIRLSSDIHRSIVDAHPGDFKEDMSANTFSVNSLIQSYEYAMETPESKTRCGDDAKNSVEKHEIKLSPTSRYVFLEITKAPDHGIIVTPQLTFKNTDGQDKQYVFAGAIQYAARDTNRHYSFHIVDYLKIKEEHPRTIEGVNYVKYGVYGNEGEIFTGKTEEENKEYKLSLQARVLVYRSEEAMDTWNNEVDAKKGELNARRKKQEGDNKKDVEEPAPTLSSGKTYQTELRSKIPEELTHTIDEIKAISSKDFFQEYDQRMNEIDTKIKEINRTIDELAPQIQSYLDQYKNNKSSNEQKAAFQAIEAAIDRVNQQSNEIQHLLLEQPKSQEGIVSISTYIESKRAELLQKKYELERSSIGLKTAFQMEEDKNIEDGQTWVKLYPILHIRFEDRKEVFKPVKESNQRLDDLLGEVDTKKKAIKANTVFFAEEVQTKLSELVQSISGNSQENDAYRTEFLGGVAIKTGQEFYDEMVGTEGYQTIQRQINEKLQTIQQIQTELNSIQSAAFPLAPSNENSNTNVSLSGTFMDEKTNTSASSSSTPGYEISEEDQPPIELVEIEEDTSSPENVSSIQPSTSSSTSASASASSSSRNDQAEQSESSSNPVPNIQQKEASSPSTNQSNTNVNLSTTFMTNPSTNQSSTSASNIPIQQAEQKESNTNVNLGNTFMAEQQGGASSEEMIPYLEKRVSAYTEMNHQLDLILETKRRYVEEYEKNQIQQPYAELVIKSHADKEKNEESTLTPIEKLRRNMIRLDILHSFQTAQQDFWKKVKEENETEHSSLQSIIEAIRTSYLKVLDQHRSDITNAYYLYLLNESKKVPSEKVKDIRVDVTESYVASQSEMKKWTDQVFVVKDVYDSTKELKGLIKQYSNMTQNQTQYAQLPSLRTEIEQKIIHISQQIDEKQKTIPNVGPSILPSLSREIRDLIDVYELNKQTFLERDDELHQPRSFSYLAKIIQIVSDQEKERTQSILDEISDTLRNWYTYFTANYDIEYGKYKQSIESAERQLRVAFSDLVQTIQPIKSHTTQHTALPENYAETYKGQLLGENVSLLNPLDDMKEIQSSEQNQAIVSMDKEMEENQKQLDMDEKELIYNPDLSDSYLQQTKELIEKYERKKDLTEHHITALKERKSELEKERKTLEEYEKSISEKIAKDAATNQTRSSLSSTNATSLLQVIEELRVRQEVQEQIQQKKEELDRALESVETQLTKDATLLSSIAHLQAITETKKNEITELAYTHNALKEQEDYLGAVSVFANEEKADQNKDRQLQKEQLQAQIDAARKEVKLQTKIQQVEAAIQKLEQQREAVPNENQPQIQSALEKKQAKLRSLQEMMAEQVALRKNLSIHNKRIANTETYPEKKEENTDEKEEIPSVIRTSERIHAYMKEVYDVELTPSQTKELTHVLKEMTDPSISIKEIIEGNDLFNLLYKAAVKTGITISPDKNLYLSYIDSIHNEYQEEKDMDLYQRIMSEQDRVGDLEIPNKETDYINRIQDELTKADTTIREQLDSDEFVDQMTKKINTIMSSIQADKTRNFLDIAKRYQQGKITQEDYESYRRYLELLYALTESPLKEDLIQSYTHMYETMKKDKEQAERNRIAQEEEQKRQQEEETKRQEQQKQEHYDRTHSTIKSLLRDMRSHISFIQKTNGLPAELKDLSSDLKEIDKTIQTYSRQFKNAQNPNAPLWTSRMPAEIEKLLNGLRKYTNSNQSVLKKSEYSEIGNTVNQLASSQMEIIEWIREVKLQNQQNSNKNYRSFMNQQEMDEARMKKEKKEAEEKRQLEEKQAEEKRVADRTTFKTILTSLQTSIQSIDDLPEDVPQEVAELGEKMNELYKQLHSIKKLLKAGLPIPNIRTQVSSLIDQLIQARGKVSALQDPFVSSPTYASINETIDRVNQYRENISDWLSIEKSVNRNQNITNYNKFSGERKTKKEAKEERKRIAAEKAESNRLAAEKAERERVEAEKAEHERVQAEKAERERIAAIRAQKEKEHKSKIDQIESDILKKADEKSKIEASLKAYDAIKGSAGFVPHYEKLLKTGRIDSDKKKEAERLLGKGFLSLSPSKLPTLTGDSLSSSIKLLKDAINPDMARLQKEIEELDQQRERLLSGENNGDEKMPEKGKESVSETNIEQSKKNREQKTEQIKEIKETIQQIEFTKNNLDPSQPVGKQTIDYLSKIMNKYDYLDATSQGVFLHDALQSSKKIIPTIDGFIEKLQERITESEYNIEDLEKKISKSEQKLRENPLYQRKNIETLETLEKSLTIGKIKEVTDKAITIMKHYPLVSESFINRLTSIKNSSTIEDDVKLRSITMVLQEFIQYVKDEYEKHPPIVSNQDLKEQGYFGLYPGRGNTKGMKNATKKSSNPYNAAKEAAQKKATQTRNQASKTSKEKDQLIQNRLKLVDKKFEVEKTRPQNKKTIKNIDTQIKTINDKIKAKSSILQMKGGSRKKKLQRTRKVKK